MPSTPRSRSGRERLRDDSGEFLNDTGNNETFSIIDTASSNPNSVLASMPTVGTDEGGDDVIVSVKESVDSGRRLQLSSLPSVPRKKARTDHRRRDSQVKARTPDCKSIYVEGFETDLTSTEVSNFCKQRGVKPIYVKKTERRGGMCCVFERICLIFYLCAYFLRYLAKSYHRIFNCRGGKSGFSGLRFDRNKERLQS
jgi:hypothetical protein